LIEAGVTISSWLLARSLSPLLFPFYRILLWLHRPLRRESHSFNQKTLHRKRSISLYPAPVKTRPLLLLLWPQRKAINLLLKTLSTVLPLHHQGMATLLMANGRLLQNLPRGTGGIGLSWLQ
jgi:hypothetical protein